MYILKVPVSFKKYNTLDWVLFAINIFVTVLLTYIFCIYANKLRLRKLYLKGASFNSKMNNNVEEIYKYIGINYIKNK